MMKIIIVGGGGHSRVLKGILDLRGGISYVGYTDLELRDLALSYLGTDEIIEKYSASNVFLVNGIGSIGIPSHRRNIYEKFKKMGYSFCAVVHPNAIIDSSVKIGDGVQIVGGAVVNMGAVIGKNTIVNTAVSIDHDCIIGAHSHLSPGAILCGGVHVGVGCHIGAGATIIQGVTIGDHVVVGAGAVVISDLPSNITAMGTPARAVPAKIRPTIR